MISAGVMVMGSLSLWSETKSPSPDPTSWWMCNLVPWTGSPRAHWFGNLNRPGSDGDFRVQRCAGYRAGSRDNRPAPDRGHSRAGSLDEAMDVGTRPRQDGRGCEGSDLGVARHRGGTGSSTLFIQTFQAHTDGEGSGRISEGGAYGK